MTSPQANPFIFNLDSPLATLERVGGKGASPARMVAAGLPIPPGFHISTDAYRRYVDENHLGDGILSAVAQAQANDPATFDRASEQIQSLIRKGTMPGDIAEIIRQWYSELGADAAVAVRSSATAEDLPDMSFAGQMETYLNVRGSNEVIDAVKRCWASLWTGRTIGYRQRHGIRTEDVSIAVVVQQLIAAQVAGVAFTANPITGARDELLINAAWGLGEAIVSGRVTPDTIIINKETGAIATQEIASKDFMTVRFDEGTREEPVPAGRRKHAALLPVQAVELARLCVKIEQLYGQPMDIEWALCDGRIFRMPTKRPKMPVSADYRFLRSIFRLRLVLHNREQREVHHPLVRPDQLVKQFFLARQDACDQPRLVCLHRSHDELTPPSLQSGGSLRYLTVSRSKLLQTCHSKDGMKSFTVNRHCSICIQVRSRRQIIILIALISFQRAEFHAIKVSLHDLLLERLIVRPHQ